MPQARRPNACAGTTHLLLEPLVCPRLLRRLLLRAPDLAQLQHLADRSLDGARDGRVPVRGKEGVARRLEHRGPPFLNRGAVLPLRVLPHVLVEGWVLVDVEHGAQQLPHPLRRRPRLVKVDQHLPSPHVPAHHRDKITGHHARGMVWWAQEGA
jgi:hypothetical protein